MMATKTNLAGNVNHFPSITWHHLHINHGYFEGAVAGAIQADVSPLPDGITLESVNFQDSYAEQNKIHTQLGKDFEESLDKLEKDLCIKVQQIKVSPGTNADKPVKISYAVKDGSFSASDTVIIADEGSSSTFIFDYEGDPSASGVFGNRIRVYCGENASVRLVTVNLLGSGIVHYNGIGSSLKDNARLEMIQIELGGKETFSGSYNTLSGYKSAINMQGAYLCDGDKSLDINYVSDQEGVQSESMSNFNGILLDNARKTWRGTIDFQRGAREAKGDEQENVLLLSPDVVNKSMPVILCDEENVEGRHGGSIGKIGKDELLYLETRGIDEQTARKMMVKSRINSIARHIPDETVLENIHAYLEEHL
ncbi:MAG: SufD family Fe-S cluster assembly protein [Treponema sp.]|nr:SufD family Fe-S cluster assembly protein [Treponema sp.]